MAVSKTPYDFEEILKKFQDISPQAAMTFVGSGPKYYRVDYYFSG